MKISFPQLELFVKENDYKDYVNQALTGLELLLSGNGKGNDFLGWLNLPDNMEIEIDEICRVADLYKNLDTVVIIGIGGSYLGAKAIIEALNPFFNKKKPEIIFAGHNLNADYHAELLDYLSDKEFGIIAISKSGTTTEPAIAFRLLYNLIREKHSDDVCKDRITLITDKEKGALRPLAQEKSYNSFIIDDNVGGRFSVLSAVGLLPIAIAGFDIRKILNAASIAKVDCLKSSQENPAIKYAAVRNKFYNLGYKLEIMVNYNSRLNYFAEWWKQLYGESEGKENKGIFPASVSFTTDLHSLGQYIQQGERFLFETVLYVKNPANKLEIPFDKANIDKLNYLAGKDMEFVNKKASEGTLMAHLDGKVPNILIEIDRIDEENLGYLIYFFEVACGISAYILDVNPFDQPGVEDYKRNMFKLLGKK